MKFSLLIIVIVSVFISTILLIMIVVKISHGLGNQLFQYAAARHLSLIKNTSLCLDTRYYLHKYETDTAREFKLAPFNLNYSLLHQNPVLVKLSKATKLVKGRTLKPFFHLMSEQGNVWTTKVQKANSLFVYLKGFWQSEKYFKDSEDIIRKELSFSFLNHSITQQYRKMIGKAANPVSLHIRRGDYVNNPGFNNQYGFIGLRYYEDAIRTMEQQTGPFQLFVFSDDPAWVGQNLKIGKEYTFVNNENGDGDMADIHLMSLCRHNIIANSSFSWWGAWLNGNENKVVTSPAVWYKNKPGFVMDDLLPESWIRL